MSINLNPQKGFRDLYPEDKIKQNYLFSTLKQVADLSGFLPYDGPLIEDINIYLNKSSEELVNRQTFQIKTKSEEKQLVLRPEMTPSLARMIAKKAGEINFPIKLFNLGLRYRYEAPQKGREREFYQADFDLLGETSILADAEIINTAINIFLQLKATDNDFVLFLNSRYFMENKITSFGISKNSVKAVLNIIDRKDKVTGEEFSKSLKELSLTDDQIDKLNDFLTQPITPQTDKYFKDLFVLLKDYQIDQYCQINPQIVRGLDYYTGLVFEVKEKGGLTRSLLGGGRYDNLVASYNPKLSIPGVGFATSDVVLQEFITSKNLQPKQLPFSAQILVTIFDQELISPSLCLTKQLRDKGINTEIYPNSEKKLDKQLKWANKNKIPYVIVIGPEEAEKNSFKIKNMATGEQKEMKEVEEVIKFIKL